MLISANLSIDVGGQASPQQVFFGTEPGRGDLSRFVVPIECVAAVFFAIIALMFIGLGQAMGRAFAAAPDRVAAYSVDILGSLAGIICFTLGLVLSGGSGRLVCHRPGGGLPGLAEGLAASALRSAGTAGADRLGGDTRRGTFPDFLVALLPGHVPSAKRHD